MSEEAETTELVVAPPKKESVYTVKNYVDALQLKRDLAFSVNDLTSAMMQQASMFSHYGVLAAEASRQVDVVKMLLENTEAAVYQKERDAMAAAGEKPTEALLEKRVARHPRVISMKRALNEAKRVEAIGKTAMEAFRHRRDMLVQQGLISREEMKGEARIAERSVREEAMDHQRTSLLERIKNRAGAEE